MAWGFFLSFVLWLFPYYFAILFYLFFYNMAQSLQQKGQKRKEVFEDYDGFVEKFKPKKTTDDCYTPQEVYDVIVEWLTEKGAIDANTPIVRPFWPGGDYEHEKYDEGCVVVDNPPFSILSKIAKFYSERGIGFFLFAPVLTAVSSRYCQESTVIVIGESIKYENGAKVATAFVTNLPFCAQYAMMTAPELGERIKCVQKSGGVKRPSYKYPENVISTAILNGLANVDLKIRRKEVLHIKALDAQRVKKKAVYGGGYLVSDYAAARLKAARLKAARESVVWELSERERTLISRLNDFADEE